MYNCTAELARQMRLSLKVFTDMNWDEVAEAVNEAFAKFEQEGISQKDLSRIKAGQQC